MIAPILESNRLIIKPLNTSFISQKYVEWMNDKEVIKYLSSGGDYNLNKLKKFLEETEKKEILFWAIIIKENNTHIGNIKIDPIDHYNGTCEYRIMMGDKNEWGKGFAYEVSELVINYCFKNLNLRKITLGCIEDNKIAISLYKKLNFKIEANLIEHILHNGKYVNVIRMALFNKNFLVKK